MSTTAFSHKGNGCLLLPSLKKRMVVFFSLLSKEGEWLSSFTFSPKGDGCLLLQLGVNEPLGRSMSVVARMRAGLQLMDGAECTAGCGRCCCAARMTALWDTGLSRTDNAWHGLSNPKRVSVAREVCCVFTGAPPPSHLPPSPSATLRLPALLTKPLKKKKTVSGLRRPDTSTLRFHHEFFDEPFQSLQESERQPCQESEDQQPCQECCDSSS